MLVYFTPNSFWRDLRILSPRWNNHFAFSCNSLKVRVYNSFVSVEKVELSSNCLFLLSTWVSTEVVRFFLIKDCNSVHTVAIPLTNESSLATTPSGEHPFLSTSSNQSVLVARTRTQSIIDRSSPYNVIETSNEDEQIDENVYLRPINDEQIDEQIDEQLENNENDRSNLSHSSSLTSGTDVFMDAVDILHDDDFNESSGKSNQFRWSFSLCSNWIFSVDLDGSLTPIGYGSFSKEIIDAFGTNLHRIDKDVARCDRTYAYFTNLNNLKKLRNIMCT